MTNLSTVVIDNGTGYVKCGLSGQGFPSHLIPTLVGRPILRSYQLAGPVLDDETKAITKFKLESIVLAERASENRKYLDISYPVDNGVIRQWDDMTSLWRYAFDQKLSIDPKNSRVLLTEPASNPKSNRKKMVEIMLEQFECAGVHISVQAVLTLYAQGLTSGLVVDSGEGVTNIIPVSDGFVLSHLSRRIDIAGRDVTNRLIHLLSHRGYSLNKNADMEHARQIKDKFAYVAMNLDTEKKLSRETTALIENILLQDGRIIKIGSERYEAPEILFKPHLIGSESDGLHEIIFDTIQKSAIDIRPKLYKNIVLSGGTTMLPGFSTRLNQELRDLYLEHILKGEKDRMLTACNIKVEDSPRRNVLVWIGGSVLADLMKDNDSFWISKKDWEEDGARCFEKCSGY